MLLRIRACLLLLGSACAHASTAPQNGSPVRGSTSAASCALPAASRPAELIRQHGTVLDAYQLEGGVWLEHAPVLINEDFDFALAMGMEGGIGAGLAAAKRMEHNAQKAAALHEIAAPPELQERLAALRCCGVHVYFVLWGPESASLRTIVDLPGHVGHSRTLESEPGPLAGQAGWTAPNVLLAEAKRALADIDCPARSAPAPGLASDSSKSQ